MKPTNQKPQQESESMEWIAIALRRAIIEGYEAGKKQKDTPYQYTLDTDKIGEKHFRIIKNLISTERQRVIEEVRGVVEGLDSYYVLNGNITKHKGGHLLDKDYLLQALNKLEEDK